MTARGIPSPECSPGARPSTRTAIFHGEALPLRPFLSRVTREGGEQEE